MLPASKRFCSQPRQRFEAGRPMVRKVWIAVLVFALCLHLGVGAAIAYVTLCSPHPFRYAVTWSIIFGFFVLAVADCIALHRRIIDDDGESLRLRL